MLEKSSELAYPFVGEGKRLRAFVDARWGRSSGGIRKLAASSGVTPEALYAWFRGENLPGLSSVRALARALQVRPLEIVAAIEGETAPEAGQTVEPEWARRLSDEIIERLGRNQDAVLEAIESNLARELARYGLERARDEQSPDAETHGTGATTPTGAVQR